MLTFKTVFHGTVWGAKRTVNLTQNPQQIPHFRQEDTRTDRPSQEYDLAAQEPPTNPQPNFSTALLFQNRGFAATVPQLSAWSSALHWHSSAAEAGLQNHGSGIPFFTLRWSCRHWFALSVLTFTLLTDLWVLKIIFYISLDIGNLRNMKKKSVLEIFQIKSHLKVRAPPWGQFPGLDVRRQ